MTRQPGDAAGVAAPASSTKRTTLRDLGRATGYSRTTVALALRSDPKVPPATRDKIRRVAQELRYEPNALVSQVMGQLRHGRAHVFRGKLALLNASRDPHALQRHPSFVACVQGCVTRARELGYSFDEFWLHESSLSARRWLEILEARGIRGLLLVGMTESTGLPERLQPVWAQLPAVAAGAGTRQPSLSCATVDYHLLAMTAVEQALALGYRRPGLVLEAGCDPLTEHRLSGGYLTAQRVLAPPQRLPIFEAARGSNATLPFGRWLDHHRPDVLLAWHDDIGAWLARTGHRVPDDLGIIHLERRPTEPAVAGFDQHHSVTGQAAVDLLVAQIRSNQVGTQPFPRATLIAASWSDGATVARGATPPGAAA